MKQAENASVSVKGQSRVEAQAKGSGLYGSCSFDADGRDLFIACNYHCRLAG